MADAISKEISKENTKDVADRTKPNKKGPKPPKDLSAKPKQKPKQQSKKMEGAALIGIDTAKEVDLGEWYSQVLTKGNMISYYDVSGCYILEPASYAVWESIQAWFNLKIKAMGVRNCYFPLFISEDNLQREKDHVEGFAAEVAWVTEGGKSKLDKKVAVRPTSETAMYGYFAKKIQSHRDLPLKLNQWNSVVRWEFKHPMPFIRSREFLWQEGHTAHLTEEAADREVLEILDHYAGIYEELLAVPVIKGRKTLAEQFPGAHYTTTIEGYIPATGRGIQAGTSHCLGQHFSKMFNITVEDPSAKGADGERKPPIHVWQNSWGLSTRSIGVMVLVHSDNKGLVIPPRVAEIQVVIVPVGITAKTSDEDRATMYGETRKVAASLRSAGVRVELDLREGYSPGYKFNDWELKGVPLRLEIGPKDLAKGVATTSRRDQEKDGKGELPLADLATSVPALLETIQKDMYNCIDAQYKAHRKQLTNWDDFVPSLNNKNVNIVPHCLQPDCEDTIKDLSTRKEMDGAPEDSKAPSMGAKSLCIPFEQPAGIIEGETRCINPECGRFAKKWVNFGRSY
ncbi:prolyl-tRNA synthetase 2 [Eremomyces bilateralis CBS 781.70]|uniref:proline--tRNA ligase n=1 Tax=Eremomyces bilateralis CBS 781.70 TaxID=1392243 RepID=A0A6G1GGB2_9PEZI|nr:prolyl-tRNA synthetase 2 [Eremomyces bilateralis CBS 781.70]KAF1816900.1 prolyl-tRNA synthetase 2 [Eremomyces bilateralis CBS 781.70]